MIVPLHPVTLHLSPAASPSPCICTNLHISSIYMQGPWIWIQISTNAMPLPALSVCHVSPAMRPTKKKISTKHAREPLSLTLSPPLPWTEVYCVYGVCHNLLLRTPCSVLYIDIYALRTGTACAAYTAWCGMVSVRRVCLRLVRSNREWVISTALDAISDEYYTGYTEYTTSPSSTELLLLSTHLGRTRGAQGT